MKRQTKAFIEKLVKHNKEKGTRGRSKCCTRGKELERELKTICVFFKYIN